MASLEITESVGWPSPVGSSKFYTYVREERLFCAALAHLLLQRGGNLQAFLSLVNDRLPEELRSTVDTLDGAEVYLEFTYLRDSWFRLGRDNETKRSAVLSLLNRVESLRRIAADLPPDISTFNSRFMGERGSRIRLDIVYPGQWSVESLYQGFGTDPEAFRELCKFKWSFNIKPDLVIVLPGARPICVEAKLESKEGSYPASPAECVRFDEVFGLQQGRVSQFSLQRFMFEVLLGTPCQQVVLSRDLAEARSDELHAAPYLSWQDTFAKLDTSSSIAFIENLAKANINLANKNSVVIDGGSLGSESAVAG